MAYHDLSDHLLAEELVLLVRIAQRERLKVGLALRLVRVGHNELARIRSTTQLTLDVVPNLETLLSRGHAIFEVDGERRGQPVLDVVDVVGADLLVEFDVVDATYVVGLWVVVRTG